jgi:hypothetical protein
MPLALPGMPPIVPPGSPEKSKTPIYIAGGVVLLLVVGIGVYLALRKPSVTAASPGGKKSSAAAGPTPTQTPPPVAAPSEPEVFQVSQGGYTTTKAAAAAVCTQYGAQLATKAQVQTAANRGADWCSTGWVADEDAAYYPAQVARPGCLSAGGSPGLIPYTPTDKKAAVNCYGVKPNASAAKAGESILPFNQPSGLYFQPSNAR